MHQKVILPTKAQWYLEGKRVNSLNESLIVAASQHPCCWLLAAGRHTCKLTTAAGCPPPPPPPRPRPRRCWWWWWWWMCSTGQAARFSNWFSELLTHLTAMGRSDPGRAGSRPWRSGSAGFYLKYSFVARAETFYNYGGPRPGPGRTQTLIKMVGWWGCGRGPVSLLIDWQLSVCSIHCVQARTQAAKAGDMCWSEPEPGIGCRCTLHSCQWTFTKFYSVQRRPLLTY